MPWGTQRGKEMPISGFQRPLAVWSQESINKVEPRPGVFEFYDQYELVIYLMGAPNLKEALQNLYNSGFANKPCLRQATHFRWEYVDKFETAVNNHMIVFKSTSGGTLPDCMK